jgi:uncharacterized protein
VLACGPMAGTSLLVLIDDIASLLDDVATLTKVATKKTAGVLGDDLALNAQQVAGILPERELPVVWAVAKGSLLNKLILIPAALAISALAPWLVTPLLMLGGAYLCYEGVEKLAHRWLHADAETSTERPPVVALVASDPDFDLVAFEREKIRGAIRTDFVLSAEIIVIALGTVASFAFSTRLAVLSAIGALMTVGVYGIVAAIVKLDDLGLHLSQKTGAGTAARAKRALGAAILAAAPYLMKGLSIAGTVAMFLVGGGILTHGVPALHHAIDDLAAHGAGVPGVGGVLAHVMPAILNGLAGIVAGAVALAVVLTMQRAARTLRRAN